MFEPGEVVYAHVKNTNPPKNKYFVTIYQDDELRIVTCFTTTKSYHVGCPFEQLVHGYVKSNGQITAYFFDRNVEVGVNNTNQPFRFPEHCVIPFDYGVRIGTKEQFLNNIEREIVVCKLHPKEYENIVYAMYKSPKTDPKYKPYLDKVLQQICQ